jgi:aspartoacylase
VQARTIATDVMNFLAAWNSDTLPTEKVTLPVYVHRQDVAYPVDAQGKRLADVNPAILADDYGPIKPGTPLLLLPNGSPYELWEGPGDAEAVFIREQAYLDPKVNGVEMAMQLAIKTTATW